MGSRRSIRQGQLVSPYGVGAIVDIGQESFVIADISRWQLDGLRPIEDSHLQERLRRPLKTPVARDGKETIAIHRFPRWHFCPRCRLMRFVTGRDDAGNDYAVPKCGNRACGGTELTPMGFVAACKNGHLSEVDWHWWAHSRKGAKDGKCSPETARMRFETTGQGGGDWSAISVVCACKASRDFVGLVQVESPLGRKCRGGQPWQFQREACGESIWVYRRAASNLHFPRSISALDLSAAAGSDASETDLVGAWKANDMWAALVALAAARVPPQDILRTAKDRSERIAARYGCAPSTALEALNKALFPDEEAAAEDHAADAQDVQSEILREEWKVLAGAQDVATEFLVIKRATLPEGWPIELLRTIHAISMVKRLREVRALLGFRRLSPDEDNQMVEVDLGTPRGGWYPAVEAWGEGIFIQINGVAMKAWEELAAPALARRMKELEGKVGAFGWPTQMASPRFLLLHSLAHAVIRRLAYDAGYSSSSIRERIYSGDAGSTMCGILIYTADGDSEGSLGGLVRMGDPKRFGMLLQSALLDVAWCSADPVCKENDKQGLNSMNAASCHACMLASETSCSTNNCLLDRRTLVDLSEGAGAAKVPPFFNLAALAQS